MSDREDRMLLALLAYELFGGALPEDADGVDWPGLMQKANDHAVTALLYSGVKEMEGVPEAIVGRARGMALQASICSERVLNEQARIIALLTEGGIPCAVLKGTSVACLYPHPEVRLPGDVDILVGEEKLDAADAVMRAAGFSFEQDGEKHRNYRKADILVEVHRVTSLFPYTEKGQFADAYMRAALDETATGCMGGVSFPMLTVKFQLVALLAHMVQHMTSSGIGLRQLCDWAVTVHQLRGSIGQKDVELLDRCGLLRYASIVTRACEKYLGLPACGWRQDVPDELVDATMADILEVGNFYAQQGERTLSSTMMSNRREAQPGRHNPVVNYFRYARYLMEVQYPWAKSPLWVPIFSVYFPLRWVIRVMRGQRRGANPIKSMKTAQIREKLLREMELYR